MKLQVRAGATKRDIHGHILLIYEKPEERLKALAEYFRKGLERHELCVLVTPDPLEKVIDSFLSVGLDANHAVKDDDLRIFEMTETYLPHGKFVANYMLLNVANFIIEARAKGYNGIRTAGEMSWLHEHPEFLEDATAYESQIHELNATSPEFTGLCLYPVRKGSGRIIDSALKTHPSFFYDGTAHTNPFHNKKPPATGWGLSAFRKLLTQVN